MATNPPDDPNLSKGQTRWFGLPGHRDLPPEVREEMDRAREDPGPTWREWFFFHAAKWWIGLGFLIVDTWIVVSAIQIGLALSLVILAVALYLEVLTWQVLWHRPDSLSVRDSDENRLWWIRPMAVGRWTPEAEEIRQGLRLSGSAETGPDPKEFL
jgi:hypothetical protein